MKKSEYDAFSLYHPAVNFVFFLGAIGFAVMIQHPAYLLAGAAGAAGYWVMLGGRREWRTIGTLSLLYLFLTLINPLFNTYGSTLLFRLFGRPYTLEALLNGAAAAGIFVVMILWFRCYSVVMTSDKFTSLFGNLIPALSLLLVMVLRLIPNLIRKTGQIAGARKSIGKGTGLQSRSREKLHEGFAVLSALSDWALEGSVVTGDSMRARGFGSAKRSSFQIYAMSMGDWLLLALMVVLAAVVIVFAAKGGTAARYTPTLAVAPVSGSRIWGLAAYGIYVLIPSALHIKEAAQWHISRSKI